MKAGSTSAVAVDKLLTGRFTGIPCFFAIMAFVFAMTFGPIGGTLSDLMSEGVDIVLNALVSGLESWGLNPVAESLLIDGVGAGVGAVIGLLPTIVTLFFFLSILRILVTWHASPLLWTALCANRPFWQKHRSASYGIWMLSALDHGNTHAFQRTRPQNDNDAGALHELQRKKLLPSTLC